MLKLCRVTKVKVLFLVLVYVLNFNLFEFSAAILEISSFQFQVCSGLCVFFVFNSFRGFFIKLSYFREFATDVLRNFADFCIQYDHINKRTLIDERNKLVSLNFAIRMKEQMGDICICMVVD